MPQAAPAQQRTERAMSRNLKPAPTIAPDSIEKWMEEGRSRTMSPESLRDGTWLLQASEENAQSCRDMSGRQAMPLRPLRSLTWGSACSGSEGVRFCFEALALLALSQGSQVRFEHAFSCESNPDKLQWIAAVNALAPQVMASVQEKAGRTPSGVAHTRTPCLFTDICKLGEEHCARVAHRHEARTDTQGSRDVLSSGQALKVSDRAPLPDGHCLVPQVDILVVGTSCKDMSKINVAARQHANAGALVLSGTSSRGGSAQTFRGMLAYVDSRSPSIIIFENVDSIDDKMGATSNLDILLAEMGNRGYENQVIMSDAAMMGLPARRRRVYVIFLKIAGNPLLDFSTRSVSAMFTTLRAVMCSCVRSPCCATKIFLPPYDPAVKSYLESRREKREKLREAAKKSGPAHHPWMNQHLAFARVLKYRWGQPVPEDLKANEWFETLTDREKDVVRLTRAQSPDLLFRDLSQSIARANETTLSEGLHCLPTLLPRMLLWCEKEQRLWLGREALIFQGFPVIPFLQAYEDAPKRPQAWSPSEALMTDLAGNAMSLPVVLAILQSLLTSLSWMEEADADVEAEEAGKSFGGSRTAPRKVINAEDWVAQPRAMPPCYCHILSGFFGSPNVSSKSITITNCLCRLKLAGWLTS